MSIIVISGPSGVGKTSIVKELINKLEGKAVRAITATTRSPRGGERDGVDYYFLTREQFMEKISKGDFLEYATYGENFYGCPRDGLMEQAATTNYLLVILDVQGAQSLRNSNIPHMSLFISPPSMQILKQRMVGRQTESQQELDKRLSAVESEMGERYKFDHILINDQLSDVVGRILSLL